MPERAPFPSSSSSFLSLILSYSPLSSSRIEDRVLFHYFREIAASCVVRDLKPVRVYRDRVWGIPTSPHLPRLISQLAKSNSLVLSFFLHCEDPRMCEISGSVTNRFKPSPALQARPRRAREKGTRIKELRKFARVSDKRLPHTPVRVSDE